MELDKNSIIQDKEWNTIIDPHKRIDKMCSYILQNINVNPENCQTVIDEAKALSNQVGYIPGQILCLDLEAFVQWHEGQVENALSMLDRSIELRVKTSFHKQYGWHIMCKAMIIWSQGKYDEAFSLIYDGLRHIQNKQIGNYEAMWCHWTLGVFNYDLKNYDKSLQHYQKVLDQIDADTVSRFDINASNYALIGIGCCKKEKGDLESALSYFELAKSKSQEINQWMQEARSHYEIGLIQVSNDEFDQAEQSLLRSLKMRKQHHTKPGMVSSLLALSDLKFKKKDLSEAILYANEALRLAKESNSLVKQYQTHQKLYELEKYQGNYKTALDHLEAFNEMRSNVVGEETTNRIKELETKFATERAEKEAEIERMKKDEILSSIRYAKRIQTAILPSESLLEENFSDHFILYLPKDIVAGDFYWIEKFEERIYFTAADCTGHGVPGALVSVMCSNALNKALIETKSNPQPSTILDSVAKILDDRFSQSEENVQDGMDLSLCCFDKNSQMLSFAGANNPLYLIRNREFKEIKPDKQAIGRIEGRQPYTNHEFITQKGDLIISFTDGYADQFGGPKGKKIKYSAFKELLLGNSNLPLDELKKLLFEYLNNWKGDMEQVDDICILAVRI